MKGHVWRRLEFWLRFGMKLGLSYLNVCRSLLYFLPPWILPPVAVLESVIKTYTPIYPGLRRFGLNVGDLQDHEVLRTDIRILELEDYLKRKGSLYIHGPPNAENAKFIRQMADIWLWTNFVGSVRRVEATQFLEGWFKSTWRLCKSFWRNSNIYERNPRLIRRKPLDTSIRRMYIIENIDHIYKDHVPDTARDDAVRRISEFLTGSPIESSYLIIIGREDATWWATQEWGDATAFYHNFPLPRTYS